MTELGDDSVVSFWILFDLLYAREIALQEAEHCAENGWDVLVESFICAWNDDHL